MELFTVKNRISLEILKGFNNKMDAKKFRDELNSSSSSNNGDKASPGDYIVSPGRDHRKTNSKIFTIPRRQK